MYIIKALVVIRGMGNGEEFEYQEMILKELEKILENHGLAELFVTEVPESKFHSTVKEEIVGGVW